MLETLSQHQAHSVCSQPACAHFLSLKQLFPLGCGSRGQSLSLSHSAFTAQPDQALPEVGLQRVPCPYVKTCTTPIISWDTAHPARAPLVFCTQGALNSPSPPCCSQFLKEHAGELSSARKRYEFKCELNSQLLFKPCPRTHS